MTKKQLTPEEERTILLDAARKATRELDVLFALQEIATIASGAGRRKCSEESLIAANRARKILHRALSKICPQVQAPAPTQSDTLREPTRTSPRLKQSARSANGQKTRNKKVKP